MLWDSMPQIPSGVQGLYCKAGAYSLQRKNAHTCADDEDEEEEEEKPKTTTVKETVWDWDLLNENKALWLRSPSDVTDEEYLNFYKALAKVSPLALGLNIL